MFVTFIEIANRRKSAAFIRDDCELKLRGLKVRGRFVFLHLRGFGTNFTINF